MARTKVVNGVRMELTPEEETARDAEEAAWAAGAFDRAIGRLRSETVLADCLLQTGTPYRT